MTGVVLAALRFVVEEIDVQLQDALDVAHEVVRRRERQRLHLDSFVNRVGVGEVAGITNIEQVKGRSISSGSPGSGTNFMAETVFKALDIPMDSYKDSRLSFTESANALRDGTIDVGIWSVGPGTSSILDLATTHEIHIISFTPEQTQKILDFNKTYSSVELAGGVYRGVDKAVPTIGVWNVMICQASLDADLVYNLVEALYKHNDYLRKIHPSASYTTPENAVKYSPIPLHPGTIKYLKSAGIDVPAKLVP